MAVGGAAGEGAAGSAGEVASVLGGVATWARRAAQRRHARVMARESTSTQLSPMRQKYSLGWRTFP